MQELKSLSQDKRDTIKAQVGGSRLYLKAISSHKVFKGVVNKFILTYGERYRLEIENFIACTISSLKKYDTGFTYSRYSNTYSQFNKTISNRPKASYTRTLLLLDLLEKDGYIDLYRGYKDKAADDSMSACCVFTSKLIDQFDESHIIKFGTAIQDSPVEVRDCEGNPIEELCTDKVSKQVESLNRWYRKHEFCFGTYPKTIHLQRVYNNDLKTGGRFYFGELQTLKSSKRPSYIINKEKVCELDFCHMHFAILSTYEKYILPDDFKPYQVDISDIISMSEGYSKVKERQILKLGCMMLINSGNPVISLKNVWQTNIETITKLLDAGKYKEARENPFYGVTGKDNCNKIISRLIKHNHYAKNYFKRKGGMWGVLQNTDSEIMLTILLTLKRKNIPALPYHDSLVVRESDLETLKQVMKDSWKKVLGNVDNCKIDRKF